MSRKRLIFIAYGHRLALAFADTCDDYKFIKNMEEILIELWRFFKISPKRLHIYMKITLSAKQRRTMKKRLKKTFTTRWFSLHAGIDTFFQRIQEPFLYFKRNTK